VIPFAIKMESRELQVEVPSVFKQTSFENIPGFDCVDFENGKYLNLLGNTVFDKVRNLFGYSLLIISFNCSLLH
jgi:hypothetical protein